MDPFIYLLVFILTTTTAVLANLHFADQRALRRKIADLTERLGTLQYYATDAWFDDDYIAANDRESARVQRQIDTLTEQLRPIPTNPKPF